ncbi:MAG: sulfite exporter TauE/SafE family protein [Planctomycetaceae bacterium]
MNTILLALLCGGLVGFCLGALGGGGGILVWPALVFGIGVSAQEASVLAKIIVGSCAFFAAVMHFRKRTIDLPIGLSMSGLGFAGAWYGASFIQSTGLDAASAERVMFGVLAVLMLVVSGLMFRKGMRSRRGESGGTASLPEKPPVSGLRLAVFVVASLAIGFLTGFLGVGGGFMIVPTLVFVFGLDMSMAAGTSLVVITLNCVSGLLAKADGNIRWDVALLFAISSIVASAVAVRVADKSKQSTLQIAFSGLVVLLGVLMVWKLSVA